MVDILVIAYCILFICQIQIFLMLSTFIATLFLLIYKLFSGLICELKFIFNFHCLLISSHLKMGSTTFHIFNFFGISILKRDHQCIWIIVRHALIFVVQIWKNLNT